MSTLAKHLSVPVTCKIRVFADQQKTLRYARMLGIIQAFPSNLVLACSYFLFVHDAVVIVVIVVVVAVVVVDVVIVVVWLFGSEEEKKGKTVLMIFFWFFPFL